ncbi:acyl-CoA dehydrogenase family protein [Chloroflexus sp.]|uniref:acyl-CoA dehydrogenase family protein n=1 Tax=Chloroflexus sp. TaxID=1904827 RepID=UPI002ACE9190|nr:acyl-CoA dehydrogenase family protein [Chloroflexus sp.]
MEYEHSPEIKMLRQTVREFVDKEIRPIARAIDEEERVPFETLKKAAELGLLGVPFPERYGGLELGITGYCVLMEEINRVCASHATIIGAHSQLAAMSIYLGGTEQQKETYLRALIEGRMWGAWALTEPNAGSDAAHIQTTADHRFVHPLGTLGRCSWSSANLCRRWIQCRSLADAALRRSRNSLHRRNPKRLRTKRNHRAKGA